ncbi:MAG: MotE family protein [Rhizobiaceae bacterium]|jgi:flagellar motility protein MotE (MotC chaperone)|nr:MotE family protein [Rhizobiaceae bacterium]
MRGALIAGMLVLAGAALADDALSRKVDMLVTGALGPQTDAERYCRNIADLAQDAKFEWQVKTIGELEDALAQRTRELEAKRAEVETWLKKREAFMAMAEERLSGIYAKMRPGTAADQIRALDPLTGAALMMTLQPRIASAILNEMPTEDASRLASLMIDAATVADRPEGSTQGEAATPGQ